MVGKIGETIVNLIIPILFTILTGWGVAFFFNNNSLVTVGEQTQIDENQFLYPININAYNDINELRINIPDNLTEKQISSNEPINSKLLIII